MSTNVLNTSGAASSNAMVLLRMLKRSSFGYSCIGEKFFLFADSARKEAHATITESGQYDTLCYQLFVRLDKSNTYYYSVDSVKKQSNILANLNNQETGRAVISVRVGSRFHTVGCDATLAVEQVLYATKHYPGELITLWHEVEYSNVVKYLPNRKPEHAQIIIRSTAEEHPTEEEKRISREWAKKCGFGEIPYKFREEGWSYDSQTGRNRFSRSAVSRRFS